MARRTSGSTSTGPGPMSRRGDGFSSSKMLLIGWVRYVSAQLHDVVGRGRGRRQFSGGQNLRPRRAPVNSIGLSE